MELQLELPLAHDAFLSADDAGITRGIGSSFFRLDSDCGFHPESDEVDLVAPPTGSLFLEEGVGEEGATINT